MQRYTRPSPPDGFGRTVKPLKQKVERLVRKLRQKEQRRAKSPTTAAKKGRGKAGRKGKKEKIKFDSAWGKYKKIFEETQFGKCGFCDSLATKNSYGDVEHYRPKGEIWAYSPANGKEVISKFGYWWLAYDWSNYLFACQICNQKYKGSYFPVKEKSRRLPPGPRPSKKFPRETPLLLNPYGSIDPGRHLEFSVKGAVLIRNNSRFGSETIRTYGLNRKKLVDDRKDVALRAHSLACKLRKASNLRNKNFLHQCYSEGRDDKDYAGMVRCLYEEVGGMSWEQLVRTCAAELIAQRARARSARLVDELEEYVEELGREGYKHSRLVREKFERTCQMKWEELVERRALRLALDIQAASGDSENDKIHTDLAYRSFYDMARFNPSYAGIVKNIFQKHCHMKWRELERKVKRDGR